MKNRIHRDLEEVSQLLAKVYANTASLQQKAPRKRPYFRRLQSSKALESTSRHVRVGGWVGQLVLSRLRDGGGVFTGTVNPTVTGHRGRLDGQHRHAGRGRPLPAVGCHHRVAVHQWVPGVTRGSGDGCCQRNGHEAEPFALQVLHGGAHVFLHELRDLLLRHSHAVVGRRRLVPVPSAGPAIGTGLDTVTSSLQRPRNYFIFL